MLRRLPTLAAVLRLALGFLFVPVVAGCGPSGDLPPNGRLRRVVPDQPPAPGAVRDLLTSEPFEFGWQEGGGGPEMMGHYHTVRIGGDGRCVYTAAFHVMATDLDGAGQRRWTRELRQVTFALPPEAVRQLRQLLADVGLIAVARAYYGTWADAEQVRVQVRAGGTDKRVLCRDRYVPGEVRRVAAFVHAEIMAPQRAAVAAGRVLGDDEEPGLLFLDPY